MKVLVVDDSEMALSVMSRILERHRHEVHTLPSPIGVTHAVLRKDIDVVVIDVNLPAASGDRIASLFRANRRLDRVGVVLVSGIERDELGRLAEAAGADSFVSKADLDRGLNEAVVSAKARRAS